MDFEKAQNAVAPADLIGEISIVCQGFVHSDISLHSRLFSCILTPMQINFIKIFRFLWGKMKWGKRSSVFLLNFFLSQIVTQRPNERKAGRFMKITAFNGSPWGQDGHTHIMVQEFSAGAVQAGAEIQSIPLVRKEIRMCIRCGGCFYKTPGKCALKDDMSELVRKFLASDVVIFATPVYIDNVTGLMKVFIDRLQPVFEPYYEKDSSGECRHRVRFKKCPKLFVISSCGMPGQSHFQVLQLFFRRMARSIHTEIVGEIYRSAAGLLLLSRQEFQFKPVVMRYKELLFAAGKEFAGTGRIGPETLQRLQEPLISTDDYIEYANMMWDKIMAKHRFLGVFG